jgi:ribosomal protein L17
MLRGIVTDVLKYGKVETTLMRAKEAQSLVDKMITLGKRGDLHARRQVMSYVFEPEVVYDLFIKPRPNTRTATAGIRAFTNSAQDAATVRKRPYWNSSSRTRKNGVQPALEQWTI